MKNSKKAEFQIETTIFRCSFSEMFCEKGVLKISANFTGKHLCHNLQACNFIKKETLAQVFSYEVCKIFKNIDLYRTPPMTASASFFQFSKKSKFWVVVRSKGWKETKVVRCIMIKLF